MSNWATGNPKNLADYCIEMRTDLNFIGKWDDEPCGKSNLIVCQRRQALSLARMGDILIKLQQELAETKKQLAGTQLNLTKNEQNLVETQHKLAATQERLTTIEANSVPIGFTYIQLPKDRTPKDVWPSFTWTDVSIEYIGVFFRVEGGGAAPFGQIQTENGPFIEQILTGYGGSIPNGPSAKYDWSTQISLPKTGWTNGFRVGDGETGQGTEIFFSIKRPNISEIRPKNMAMRVWRRTA